MLQAILKHYAPIPKPERFSSYLFIGPHPDDIELGCAPTVKKLTDAGKRVSFLIVTDGRMGASDPAQCGEKLVETRRREARASAALLGVTDVTFLPFADGGLYRAEDAAIAISEQIVRLRPDVVFAPDPDVRSECHADHCKVGLAAKMSMVMSPFASVMESVGGAGSHAVQALALYYTDRPNTFVGVRKTFSMRMQAIAAHESQFDEATRQQLKLYFTLRSIRFGLRRFSSLCDGYRVLAPVHMHCFPEAARW